MIHLVHKNPWLSACKLTSTHNIPRALVKRGALFGSVRRLLLLPKPAIISLPTHLFLPLSFLTTMPPLRKRKKEAIAHAPSFTSNTLESTPKKKKGGKQRGVATATAPPSKKQRGGVADSAGFSSGTKLQMVAPPDVSVKETTMTTSDTKASTEQKQKPKRATSASAKKRKGVSKVATAKEKGVQQQVVKAPPSWRETWKIVLELRNVRLPKHHTITYCFPGAPIQDDVAIESCESWHAPMRMLIYSNTSRGIYYHSDNPLFFPILLTGRLTLFTLPLNCYFHTFYAVTGEGRAS